MFILRFGFNKGEFTQKTHTEKGQASRGKLALFFRAGLQPAGSSSELGTQMQTTESHHRGIAVLLHVVAYGELAVHDVFLEHQGVFLVELLDTALHDVVQHRLGNVARLFSRYGGDDFAGLLGLFGRKPTPVS